MATIGKRLAAATAVVLAIETLMSFVTTQYLAVQFSQHTALGEPLWAGFYPPWKWAMWSYDWYGAYPQTIKQTISLFSAGSAMLLGVFGFGVLLVSRKLSSDESLHGTAHWATRKEIEDSGLLPEGNAKGIDGVYVGGWYDPKTRRTRYLIHNGPEHLLAFAPTRSGKGVGLILPTLLAWKGSVLCYDIKGENWALTAGWRKQAGSKVMKFDPTSSDGSGVAFNPLAEIRLGEFQEVADAQNIASILADPQGKGLESHWDKTGFSLLTAAILHCCYAKPAASLSDVDALLANPEKDLEEVLDEMLEHPHKDGKPHPLVAQEARAMLNKAEAEQASVVSTALSFLSLYRDPVVMQNTNRSDFRISDLMNDTDPVSLYLVVRPSDSERLRPLIRLIVTQIVRVLTERIEFEGGRSVAHYKHRLLLLLDEFASLKQLSVIEEALAFMAGYGLKGYLIVQDLQQLTKAYSKDESITGNCHVRIAYAPNKMETAELLSRMAGTSTVVRKQTSLSGKRAGALTSVSESLHEVQRPLLTADEATRLPGPRKNKSGGVEAAGDMLIFVAGQAPIYGRQILYFQDPVFSARAKITAPQTSDRIPERGHESLNA